MNCATPDPIFFNTIPLSPQLARAVEDLNYKKATSIQANAIPYLLDGLVVIGCSGTGTGKTAAFGIPAVECVVGEIKQPQVLVLSPTRELAMQITRELQKYAKYKEGVCVATVYGGASMSDQIRFLKRANIVVGTPGRLMDHLRRKTLKLGEIKMVVLDEADEMLSMGFVEDIQTILSQAPDKRQTVLFSATMPPPILKISQEFLTKPHIIDVMAQNDNRADIKQTYYYVPQHKKQDALTLLLQYAEADRSIIFCNTKSMVDNLTITLHKQNFRAIGLHGDMTQAVRNQVMDRFRSGDIQILIATDVAARGIDINDVDTVINFDLPQSFEYYVHRIGRTGRAGRAGVSQTLVCNGKQLATLKSLIRFTGSPIEECRLPTSEDMMEQAVAKMAAELLPQMQTPISKSAKMLVERLLCIDDHSITSEQVAYTLAEKLLGGDRRFMDIPRTEKCPLITRTKACKEISGYEKKAPMVIVAASIGRNAHITPNHLVGSLTELLGVPSSSIGKIDIKEEITLIGLREDDANALLHHKKPIRIKGISVIFEMQKKGNRLSIPQPKQKQTSGHKSFKNCEFYSA